MKPAVKKQLVEALRSGNYKQGRGFLKKVAQDGEVRHCCLGVLCDIYANTAKPKVGWREHASDTTPVVDEHTKVYAYGLNRAYSLPNRTVMDWAGLSLLKARVLATKNDRGASFAQIANYIEKNL